VAPRHLGDRAAFQIDGGGAGGGEQGRFGGPRVDDGVGGEQGFRRDAAEGRAEVWIRRIKCAA
jgi:hypothetical protein